MNAETIKLALDCLACIVENADDDNALSKNEEVTNTIILSLFNLLRNPLLRTILRENSTLDGSNSKHSLNSRRSDIDAKKRVNSITGQIENDNPNNNLRASIFRLIALMSDKNPVYAQRIVKRAVGFISNSEWSGDQPDHVFLLSDFLGVIGTACLVSDINASDPEATRLIKKCFDVIGNYDHEMVWLRALEVLMILELTVEAIEEDAKLYGKYIQNRRLRRRIDTRLMLLGDYPPILDIDFSPKLPRKAMDEVLSSQISQYNSSNPSSITSSNANLTTVASKASSIIGNQRYPSGGESGSELESNASQMTVQTIHSTLSQPKRFHSAGKSRGNSRLPWSKASGASSKPMSQISTSSSVAVSAKSSNTTIIPISGKSSQESLITHHPMNLVQPRTPPKVTGDLQKLELVADGIHNQSNKKQTNSKELASPIPNKPSLVRTSSARQSIQATTTNPSATNSTSGYESNTSSYAQQFSERASNKPKIESVYNTGLIDKITNNNTKTNSYSPNNFQNLDALNQSFNTNVDSDAATIIANDPNRRDGLISRESGRSMLMSTQSSTFEELFNPPMVDSRANIGTKVNTSIRNSSIGVWE